MQKYIYMGLVVKNQLFSIKRCTHKGLESIESQFYDADVLQYLLNSTAFFLFCSMNFLNNLEI